MKFTSTPSDEDKHFGTKASFIANTIDKGNLFEL